MTDGLPGLVYVLLSGAVGRATGQDEAAITIAAFDIAFFVDFKPDARMAECGWHITRSIAGNAGRVYTEDFGWLVHTARLATHRCIV